jgi:Major intrinsic protein
VAAESFHWREWLAELVWQGAPLTGTSLKARSLGPAVVASSYGDLWLYVIGPLAGSILATLIVVGGARLRPVTAKLFHDPRYESIFMHDAVSE